MKDQNRSARGDEARPDPAEKEGEQDDQQDDQEDLRERFPDPDTDARLRVPRGDGLPQVPTATFERPRLPQADPQSGNPRMKGLAGDLRGMGEASTVGITLAASIAIGTGLG